MKEIGGTFGSSIAMDSGLKKRLTNTFGTVSVMLGITALTSYLTLGLRFDLLSTILMVLASIAIIFGVQYFKNSPFGLVLLAVFSAITGAAMAPMLTAVLATQGGNEIIFTAFALTAAATAGCTLYCITTRRDFSKIGAFLFGATLVLIVASLIGMFFQSTVFSLVISGAGVLIFTGWLLHDISRLVIDEGSNYITASIGIYLDIINMFTHLVRFLGTLSNRNSD